MANDEITSFQEQLDAHRRTLGVLLRQRADLGAAYAPPGVHNGIAEARAEIARITAALRERGVEAEEHADDAASPDEETLPHAPAHSGPASVNLAGGEITGAAVGANYGSITTIYQDRHAPSQLDPEQAQARLGQLPLDRAPDPAPLPPRSRMPLRHNPQFVGRDDDLRALAAILKSGRAAAITTGIGGVGKTQLAAEVAHRYGPFFAGGVFWISLADPGGVEAEIAACGGPGALELYDDTAGLPLAAQVAKVYAAWAQPIPRLLIFDNCDDLPGAPADRQLAARIPASGGCRVLVTSRRGVWPAGLGLAAHPLGVLARADSVALLRGFRADLGEADADALADALGDLPLALTLAGGYLDAYRDAAFGAPAAYLADLSAQILAHRSLRGSVAGPSLTGHEQNVRATFDLSYQRLSPADPSDALAIRLLARASHLAPGEPFPRDLLLATIYDTADEDATVQQADAIRRLVALGLLERAADGALRIHRLVAAFAQEAAQDDAAQAAVEQALIGIADASANLHAEFLALRPLQAHLRHAAAACAARPDGRAARLQYLLANYFRWSYESNAAQARYQAALELYRAVGARLGEANVLRALGDLLQFRDEHDAAQARYQAALELYRALGDRLGEANVLRALGDLLQFRGEHDAAQARYQAALELYRAVGARLGEANVYASQGRLALLAGDQPAADSLLDRAIAIYRAIGDRYSVPAKIGNYGWALRRAGQYAAARPYLLRAAELFAAMGLEDYAERHRRAAGEEDPPAPPPPS